jgi:hypothetical protein
MDRVHVHRPKATIARLCSLPQVDSRADLVLHVADQVIHHGAEIALLRDLFAATHGGAL